MKFVGFATIVVALFLLLPWAVEHARPLVIVVGLALFVAAVRAWARDQHDRSKHDDSDPLCAYYWGDRAGIDFDAQCAVCRPAR